MAKKWQLGLSIFITCLILIMIPVGIWAAQKLQVNVSNKVYFYVEDIEGTFYTQVTGGKDGITNPPMNTVFTGEYDSDIKDYILTAGNGAQQNIDGFSYDMGSIDFDKDHTVITYTFGFINTGEANIIVSFESDAASEQAFRNKNVQTAIKYEVLPSGNGSLTGFGSFTTSAIDVPQDEYSFYNAEIRAANQSTNEYSYIKITYTLTINPETAHSFSNNISLKVNLTAQANVAQTTPGA